MTKRSMRMSDQIECIFGMMHIFFKENVMAHTTGNL